MIAITPSEDLSRRRFPHVEPVVAAIIRVLDEDLIEGETLVRGIQRVLGENYTVGVPPTVDFIVVTWMNDCREMEYMFIDETIFGEVDKRRGFGPYA